MSKPLIYWCAPLLVGVLTLSSCESSPPGEAARVDRREPIRLTDVPTPPGVPPEALKPFGPARGEVAGLTLPDILAAITPPGHLDGTDLPNPPSAGSPPLAAQKFYAAGRQSLLEGDNFGAVQAFDKALRLAPGQPAILRGLGQAWTGAGNRVSAANAYRQAFAADPTDLDTVFMLGRFALEDRRWDAAILNLNEALTLSTTPTPSEAGEESGDLTDPAAPRLLRFYLANALNRGGYAHAAAAMYRDYLDPGDPRGSGASRYGRELAIIDAQRGETLTLLGDLHHRLDEPERAWEAYAAAAQIGVLNTDALRRRMLYTRLRLGQPRAAEGLVADAVVESGGDAGALELIRYAVEQGVPADRLSERLTELYETQGRPATLALAMADVLPRDEAVVLLHRHLADHPDDAAVFGRLIELFVADRSAGAAHAYAQAIDATARAMARNPGRAEAYAAQLAANAADPQALLDAFPARDPAAPEVSPGQHAAFATLHGKLLAAADRPDAAFDAYSRALELDPQQAMARVELAALHLDRGEYDAAEALLRPLGDDAPPRVTLLRVRALSETGRNDEALTLLDNVLRRSPPGSPLMRDKADLLLKLGRGDDAERTLLDMLNARPTDESVYAALLALYDAHPNDMIRNEQRLVRRMVETIPNARLTRLVRAEWLLAMNRFGPAEQILETLSEDDGDATAIRRMWLEVHIGLNRPDQVESLIDQHLAQNEDEIDEEFIQLAIRYFARAGQQERALKLEERLWLNRPPGPARSQRLAILYFLQSRHEEASRVAREALDNGTAGNNAAQLTLLLVTSLYELERYEETAQTARDALGRGVGDATDPLPLLTPLVQSLYKLERYDEAEQTVRQAIRDNPALGADLGMLLAIACEGRGDTDASRRVMEAALKDFPNHPSLNNSLGYGLANDGIRLEDAKRMIQRAVDADKDAAAYLDSMGWVLYKMADFDGALIWLEKSRQAEPDPNPVILDHLGDTYHRLGRDAEAVRVWNQARVKMAQPGYVKLDPEEEGLEGRLAAKIEAVAEGGNVPVAGLGQGVELPPDNAEPAPEKPAEPAADPTRPDA